MKRREFITFVGATATWWLLKPLTARAQQPRPRLAVLSLNSVRDEGKIIAALLDGLRALGYFSGRTIDVDYRYADGDHTRLAHLAQELIGLKPSVAVATSASPVSALKSAAPDLPIVCPSLSAAVVPSLAASYARPGGSMTGVASAVEGMVPKLLELAIDIVPDIARVGFLSNPGGASMALFAEQIAAAARARGIAMLTQQARTSDDLAPALGSFLKQQVQAVIVPANGLFVTHGTRIAQLAVTAGLPTVFPDAQDVEAGGLASYGVDLRENYRVGAGYVGKILKGVKPGDLPITFPIKLVLAVNLKTAKALGLTIPASMIGRADEVIE
jgi:putative ABC transport system substrate-binding protein